MKVLREKEGQLSWIRVATVTAPRMFFDNEGLKGREVSFVELLVNVLIEQPGFPPIIALGAALTDTGEDELEHTVWYYSAMEFYNGWRGDVPQPVTKLHDDETCEEPPEWVWPEEDHE